MRRVPPFRVRNLRAPIVLFLLAVAWAQPQRAQAHGLGSRRLHDAHPVTLHFHYSSGEAMSWTKITVHGPKDERTPFVVARTDRNGNFAFVPDRAGAWRIAAADEMGHKAVATVEIAPASSPASAQQAVRQPTQEVAPQGGQGPLWLRTVLGVSVLLNVFTGLFFYKRKQG